ncbi:hypothetical protein VIGAN_02054700 [Vigna angularis var. angularis]|uniref:Uncharacterized protein n=1 Tax=Vigna angularis var. angularis TaxID=157739 RepID=A0A0S3RBL0_PHAAN|nr:hypothetical protein VIGAN_02054700 [Vigna angularis var. angularis]
MVVFGSQLKIQIFPLSATESSKFVTENGNFSLGSLCMGKSASGGANYIFLISLDKLKDAYRHVGDGIGNLFKI